MRFQPTLSVSASAFAIALGLASPAAAQEASTPVTPSEAEQCAKLPTEQERALCVQGQAKDAEGTPEAAGDAGTIAPDTTAAREASTDTDIVVTGSRLRRSVFNSPDPITIIDPELEQKGGANNTAEILQSSPIASGSFQITSLISAGGFVTNGGVGAQTLSLRGLGAERTLVLVNGRRAGPAGTRGSIAGFDLNVIPSVLIQSVEILKTGASSVYGSDAIAGVANLKTKRATDGLEVRGFLSQPFESGAEQYNVNVAWGREFSRGHIIGGLDFFKRNDLSRGDRDYLLCGEEYIFNEAGARVDVLDPRTGRPRCNTTQTNYLALTTTRTISTGVTYNVIGYGDPTNRYAEFLPPVASTATFATPTGLFPLAIGCAATATASFELCRNSLSLLPQQSPLLAGADIFPSLKRYTGWLDGSFEITDNVELVGEFLFNRRQTETDSFRQLFFNQFSGATLGTVTGTSQVPANICSPTVRLINANCNPLTGGDPLNAGFAGNYLIQPVIGIPTFAGTQVDYMRGVVGLKADLDSNWRIDSYVQFSRSDGEYTNSRVFQDAVELQENRSQLCQPGQLTRIRRVPCLDIDFTDPRIVAGNFNAQEAAFLFGEETGTTRYDQLTAEASIAGNLFRMPAGPVGVAFGVQWRRDEIDDTPGNIALSVNPRYDSSIPLTDLRCRQPDSPCAPLISNVWGQSVAGRTAGFSRSQEAFGEVEVPLIHNTPFIRSLTLSAAARLTNVYAERDPDGRSDSSKGNWTYKLGGNWQVNDWLRFRATLGTSYRAPALFEQFLANQTGFLGQGSIDPCIRYAAAVAQGTLDARIGQRCADLGLEPDYPGRGSSATITTGGGIGVLEPETSKAKTFSVVLTPTVGLWDGMRFSLAVDYFDIDVRGQITTLGAGNIVFQCLNSDDYPNDPACSLFTRQLNPASPADFGAILAVSNPYLNINNQRNRGVDLTARITQDLGRYGRLSTIGQGTWQLEDRFELFRGVVVEDNGEIGEPKFVGNLRTTWDIGPWSLFHGMDVVGGVSSEQDLRNQRAGLVCPTSAIRGGPICPIYKFDAQFIHSASVTRSFGERFTITAGINNLFDTKPPRVSGSFGPVSVTGQTATFATQYDLVGRRAFISGRARF